MWQIMGAKFSAFKRAKSKPPKNGNLPKKSSVSLSESELFKMEEEVDTFLNSEEIPPTIMQIFKKYRVEKNASRLPSI